MNVITCSLNRARKVAGRADAVLSLVEDGRDIDVGGIPHAVAAVPVDPSVSRTDAARKIVAFAEEVRDRLGHDAVVIVHCEKGTRRSTAGAMALLYLADDETATADQAAETLRDQGAHSADVQLLAAIDDVLETDGELARAGREVIGQ